MKAAFRRGLDDGFIFSPAYLMFIGSGYHIHDGAFSTAAILILLSICYMSTALEIRFKRFDS